MIIVIREQEHLLQLDLVKLFLYPLIPSRKKKKKEKKSVGKLLAIFGPNPIRLV